MTILRILSLCLLLTLAADVHAGPSLRELPDMPVSLAGADDPAATKVYIVALRSPSVAERQLTPHIRFDKNQPETVAYAAQLGDEQERVIAQAGTGVKPIYSYRYGLNGFAARMTPAQAQKLRHLPEVREVWEDEVRPLATRHSPVFLGLFDGEKGLRSIEGLDGDGIVIGIIDSGITPEHPALDDTREADRPRACRSSWGETTLLGRWLCGRYRRAPGVLVFDEPENWNGTCETGERFTSDNCNNKLIGARWFIDGALETGPIDEGEIRSPRDADGHGTHTATTAAGNRTRAAIFGTTIGDIEGIAPKARVAAYKACWLRPGDTRASCNTSDLANAIDAAVADGVDVISYSVGSSLTRTTAPDDLALLAAARAGVVAAVAAGNEGPNTGTIGSPAGSPAVITVAASTRDGESNQEALEITAPLDLAGRYAVREAHFTPPLEDVDPIEAQLVLVDDDDVSLPSGGTGTANDACQPLVNSDEINGVIAFIQRGGCNFEDKVKNAADAGAVAALVYNIAGDPIVMYGESGLSDIPALMIGQADANLILAEFDAGNVVELILEKGFLLSTSDTGNQMARFSGRGPAPIPDVLKPDVTAPGVNILAGFSPDSAYATPGENFAYLSGTSMSTPHVAGVAALLKQAHPEWSPAAIKSALMTSARQDVAGSDGLTNAHAFDFGAGHIVPNDAMSPGLVYDITAAEYDEMEAAVLASDASAVNLPSVTMPRLANSHTLTRRVTNVGDEAGAWTVEIEAPPQTSMTVVPDSISLGPGESASFDVTVNYLSGLLDLWRFGSITWRSDEHAVYSPVAVKPTSIIAPEEITSFGGTGSESFEVEFGYSGAYAPQVHGLALPLIVDGFVDNDPTKTFTFRETDGVTRHVISVPAGQLYARFALFDLLTDGDPDDLDLYVYYCGLDGASCTRLGESGEPTSEERVDVFRPAEGLYAVHVHGFETDEVRGGPGANYQLLAWAFGEVDDRGNMSASGPAFVSAGTTGTVTVDWQGLVSNTIYLGGISHNTPQGLSGLTLVTIGN
jgi:subtilisin family serine protease